MWRFLLVYHMGLDYLLNILFSINLYRFFVKPMNRSNISLLPMGIPWFYDKGGHLWLQVWLVKKTWLLFSLLWFFPVDNWSFMWLNRLDEERTWLARTVF